MWHLHGDEEKLNWSDAEVIQLHDETCPHKDCVISEADDEAEAAVACLNELGSDHGAPQFVCADDCEFCKETGQEPTYGAHHDRGYDEEMALEGSLYPWLDDPNCDVGD